MLVQVPPHIVWPAGHVAHTPAAQYSPDAHACPQLPQLSGLTLVFTHARPHCVMPGAHDGTQCGLAPALDGVSSDSHKPKPVHCAPLDPQLSASESTSTHPRVPVVLNGLGHVATHVPP